MLVILSGGSGAGKDTMKKKLVTEDEENITLLTSYTTREKRDTDLKGAYIYISEEEFEEKEKAGMLYESNEHFGARYGTGKDLLQNVIRTGKTIVKDIDVNGTENLKKILGKDIKIVTIFLRVPREELKRRLLHDRKDMTPEKIEDRLKRLSYEESMAENYDYIIDNLDIEETFERIKQIIQKEKEKEEREKKEKEEQEKEGRE